MYEAYTMQEIITKLSYIGMLFPADYKDNN